MTAWPSHIRGGAWCQDITSGTWIMTKLVRQWKRSRDYIRLRKAWIDCVEDEWTRMEITEGWRQMARGFIVRGTISPEAWKNWSHFTPTSHFFRFMSSVVGGALRFYCRVSHPLKQLKHAENWNCWHAIRAFYSQWHETFKLDCWFMNSFKMLNVSYNSATNDCFCMYAGVKARNLTILDFIGKSYWKR